ncbi:alpha/beta hydrolase [Arsenicicoccus piscis]|uniref:DUF1023 domain-containing protein n=1 Tax=Arsenicicoccus piscis TaxID=673954 RepID=A0ABQ6HP79_9MICO|nr:alpha/beta hydrolase [Arsenicicoccus piscis]GMA20161.1 hypothetical protein GCM10025862_21820 [Arsenicicoccus piscis]
MRTDEGVLVASPPPNQSLPDALEQAAAELHEVLERATSTHLHYVRQGAGDRTWARINDAVSGEIRARRTDVSLYAAGLLVEQLRAEAADARRRFGDVDMAGQPVLPHPPSEEPAEVAAWWAGLSEADRDEVILRETPWVGRADGLPVDVRHRANLDVLHAEIERRSHLLDPESEEPHDQATEEEKRDLRGLLKLRRFFTEEVKGVSVPVADRRLYLLDARAYPLRCAFVLGDLEAADNVVVHVPGATTTVDLRLFRESRWLCALRDEAGRLTDDPTSTAVMGWFGYHAPYDIAVRRALGDSGVKVLVPGEASDERYAREAAPTLARCLDGVRTLVGPDTRLVASGHSYGASCLGLALQTSTAADALMVAGCPGLFANDLASMHLEPGQLWAAVAPADVVALLGLFGGDPLKIPGIKLISPFARTVSYYAGVAPCCARRSGTSSTSAPAPPRSMRSRRSPSP